MKKLLMLAVVLAVGLMLAIRAVAKQGNVQSDANTAHTADAMDNTGDTPTSKVTKQSDQATQGGSSYTPDEVRTTRGKKGVLRAGASAPPALYSLPLSFREEPF
jgi:cytoskeletal protein RodZ